MSQGIGNLFRRFNDCELAAMDLLISAAYRELRKLVCSRFHDDGRKATLPTADGVHESYLLSINAGQLRRDDWRAFVAFASPVLRSVIIDDARERQAKLLGGDLQRMTLHVTKVLISNDSQQAHPVSQ